MQNRSQRIPSLDGLRAVSIVLVILSHCFLLARGHSASQKGLLSLAANGSVGVSVFFVISGFLITLLLMREERRFGRIDIKDFYARRAFRILPAFLLYVGVIGLLTLAGVIAVAPRDFLHALTFTVDYVPSRNWYLGHVWSLSVEEQFYLLWPFIVSLSSRRTLTVLATAVVVLGPLIRILDRVVLPSTKYQIEYMAHTRADMLMFGCLLALLFEHPTLRRVLERANALGAPVFAGTFLLLLSPLLEMRFQGVYLKTVGYSLQGFSITILLYYLVTRPDSLAGRALNARSVVHLGALSYSLYLWQELFLGHSQPGWRTVAGCAFAFVAAELSFHLVEQPFLRMKKRLEHERIAGPALRDVAPQAGFAELP